MVERVSYAKVWGETRKEKSEYLSQLHTDYHDEVGYKYGLERGIPYDELSDEEKLERRHKDFPIFVISHYEESINASQAPGQAKKPRLLGGVGALEICYDQGSDHLLVVIMFLQLDNKY